MFVVYLIGLVSKRTTVRAYQAQIVRSASFRRARTPRSNVLLNPLKTGKLKGEMPLGFVVLNSGTDVEEEELKKSLMMMTNSQNFEITTTSTTKSFQQSLATEASR